MEIAVIYRKAMQLVLEEKRVEAVKLLQLEGGLRLEEAKKLMEAMVEMCVVIKKT